MVGVTAEGSETLDAIIDFSGKTSQSLKGFYIGPPRHGDVFAVVSDLKYLAEFYNRRGATSSHPETAISNYVKGLTFDPYSDTINYNLAARAAREGRCHEAGGYLAIARKTNPLFPEINKPFEGCPSILSWR